MEAKGFGFIATQGDGDVFFHCRELGDLDFDSQLLERRVEFNLLSTERGLRAANEMAAAAQRAKAKVSNLA